MVNPFKLHAIKSSSGRPANRLMRPMAIAFCMGLAITAEAETLQSGELYFTILNEDDAEVCRPPEGDRYVAEKYVIPEVVEYRGSTIKVVGIGEKAFYGCTGLRDVSLPATLEWIGDDAFSGCLSLGPNLELKGLNRIGSGAFSYCRGIERLDLSSYAGEMGEGVFMGCSQLAEVSFNDEIEIIPSFSFYDCEGLNSLTLPRHLREIGQRSFTGCRNLTEISIPGSVTLIGERAFSDCNVVESVNLECHDAIIEDGAFEHLCSLTALFLTGVREAGKNAFSGCSKMRWVEIDHGTECLGQQAFSGCNELEAVYCHPDVPPTIFQDTFDKQTEERALLMVPEGSGGRYEMAAYWNRFATISETAIFPVGVESITADDALKVSINGGVITLRSDDTPSLFSLHGETIAPTRSGDTWNFSVVPGVYILTADKAYSKIIVR